MNKNPTIGFSKAPSMVIMLLLAIIVTSFAPHKIIKKMSKNKATVTRYMEGFNTTDHPKILSCLTEDIVWEMPGLYHHSGKKAFDKEIENEAFTGSPTIKITRLIEESNIVVAEGTVKAKRKDGGLLDAVFCDVFIMENGLIKKLTSYMMMNQLAGTKP